MDESLEVKLVTSEGPYQAGGSRWTATHAVRSSLTSHARARIYVSMAPLHMDKRCLLCQKAEPKLEPEPEYDGALLTAFAQQFELVESQDWVWARTLLNLSQLAASL